MTTTTTAQPGRPTTDDLRGYVPLAVAAAALHVNVKTLRRRIAAGDLTAYRFGSSLLYVNGPELLALMQPVPTAAVGR